MWEWTPLLSCLMVFHVNVYLLLVSFMFSSCGKCSFQVFSFQFLLNIFLFPFPLVSLKHLHSPSVSLGQWEKDLPEFPQKQARGRLLSFQLAGDRDQVLCARGGRESLCAHSCFRSCTATGSQNTRVSSPSFTPHFTTGHCGFPWQAAHSVAADKQGRRSIAWKASCAWALSATAGVRAGLGGSLCVHTPAKLIPCYWLWDPERLLSYAVRLDNPRSQGQHSEGGLKHLEKLSLWQAPVSPHLLVHHCLF